MKDFLGELLVKLIPWIIPAFLFASWVSNWKSDGGKSSKGDADSSETKAKPQQKKSDNSRPEDTGDAGLISVDDTEK